MAEKKLFHHEMSAGSSDDIKPGSERQFGFVFAVFFGMLALLPVLHGGWPHRWLAVAAIVLAGIAVFFPRILKPLNYLWFRFGLLLHAVVNPIVMGLVFFIAVVPMGLLLRLFGKDLLSLKIEGDKKSYWIARTKNETSSMQDQF